MTQTIGDASGVEDHEDHVPSVRGKVRTIGGNRGLINENRCFSRTDIRAIETMWGYSGMKSIRIIQLGCTRKKVTFTERPRSLKCDT